MGNHYQDRGYLAKNAGGFAAGIFMGGLIGAGAMLLWAPQSGKKTRAHIQHEGLKLRNQVTETVENAVAEARGDVERGTASVRKQTKKLRQRGQDLLDGQVEIVSQAVEAEKAALHDISHP